MISLFQVLRAHILPLTNVAFNKSGSRYMADCKQLWLCFITISFNVDILDQVDHLLNAFFVTDRWVNDSSVPCDYDDVCQLFVTCDYCWSLSASLLGAMTGRVKCGTQPRGRSYTPWRATAMWCTPLHSTIHMGKTFQHLKATFVTKIHKVRFLPLKHTWDESLPHQGTVRETSMLVLQMKMLKMLNLKTCFANNSFCTGNARIIKSSSSLLAENVFEV